MTGSAEKELAFSVERTIGLCIDDACALLLKNSSGDRGVKDSLKLSPAERVDIIVSGLVAITLSPAQLLLMQKNIATITKQTVLLRKQR
ncbi:MAG TPA: hypothetical protein PLM07_06230 [Candidatus Rifleibacterium sp.]|nr:hypothetical protein [Candidatus Rifleibacterium sp.]HPT45478.1 hypothetical protein [Candidatus Rifleibacterium sp.]